MIEKMIREARSQRASDIHISEGQAVYLRIDGKLIKSDLEPVSYTHLTLPTIA